MLIRTNIWKTQQLLGELEHEQWKLSNKSEVNNEINKT